MAYGVYGDDTHAMHIGHNYVGVKIDKANYFAYYSILLCLEILPIIQSEFLFNHHYLKFC